MKNERQKKKKRQIYDILCVKEYIKYEEREGDGKIKTKQVSRKKKPKKGKKSKNKPKKYSIKNKKIQKPFTTLKI